MKIQLLNEKLTEQITSVLFPFPPVALPISKEGNLTAEDNASDIHYSTFVYGIDTEEFYLLEFSKDIANGLLAYRDRHGTISNVEILLSRGSNGDLKMTTGRGEVKAGTIGKNKYEEFVLYHDKLYSRYMSKLGRAIWDYEN